MVWEQLDCASGYMYNAIDNINNINNLPKNVRNMVDQIDVSAIDGLRHEIENVLNSLGIKMP